MISSTLWEDPAEIKDRIFSQTLIGNQKLFETEVQLRFIDLPDYHNLASPHCIQFFKALSKTSNIAIFELNSVRLLIEFLWPYARYTTQRKLFVPFVFYLAAFWAYTNFVDEIRQNSDLFAFGNVIWIFTLVLLIAQSAYFIRNEVRQILFQGSAYLLDSWNYIDLIPPIIVLTIAIMNFLHFFGVFDNPWEEGLKSIGSLLMWLKLLYFCRISRHAGYLIRMIVQVIYDMRTFLMVLLITISAVADASTSIMKKDESNIPTSLFDLYKENASRFLVNVYTTYQMILGQGDGFEY